MSKLRLFVGSSVESLDLAYAIQENVERMFDVTVWSQGIFHPSRYPLEDLTRAFRNVDLAILLFSADDIAKIREQIYSAVRDNVIFELGMAVGILGRERTFIVAPRDSSLHIPSDLAGVVLATYDGNREDRNWKAALGPACHQIVTASNLAGRTRQVEHLEHTFPGNVSCRYTKTDWPGLLKDAKHVLLSVAYISEDWHLKFDYAFKEFLLKSGRLDLFLPTPSDFGSLYGSRTHPSEGLSHKIVATVKQFCELNPLNGTGLRITMLPTGFNYMMARVTNKVDERELIISPYPNDYYGRSGSPIFQMSESSINNELAAFVEKEVAYLQKAADSYPDFERSRNIVWREERSRVFISTALSCDANCSFCYVPSLARPRPPLHSDAALQLCAKVVTDTRFRAGRRGTKILLGAFSDPFHKDNINQTAEILRFFAQFENCIHIATRFPGPESPALFGPATPNVVINYSVSSLDERIEYANVPERFKGAQRLRDAGFRTALFLRPVIKDKTLGDIDKIIALAQSAKIDVVTIGGLYIDERIKGRLKKLVPLGDMRIIPKTFVLDDEKLLQKLEITDIQQLKSRFEGEGFAAFLSSDQRIEYFEGL